MSFNAYAQLKVPNYGKVPLGSMKRHSSKINPHNPYEENVHLNELFGCP